MQSVILESAAVGCLLLAIAGCASRAPPGIATLAVEVPSEWSAADAAAKVGASSLMQWWLRFDDPLLGRLVAQALQANTNVSGAQAALRQARALRDVSSAALLPTLGSSASAQRNTSGNDRASNRFQTSLDASRELDFFGVNRSALRSTEATLHASTETF